MKTIIHREARNFLEEKEKKDIELFKVLEKTIYNISVGKLDGERLKQPFSKYKIKKIVVKFLGTDYRILYCIKEDKLYVFVIAGRENIYNSIDMNIIKNLLKF